MTKPKHDFSATDNRPEAHVPEVFQVVVECRSEQEQREVYEAMRKEGRKCRVLTL
ncbi:MAG: hypothetical protein KDA37_18715 [Planctomycetales bacterium]|nr:hypothetical protein [Planctomycetales bacterium]MCA9639598.1 hypothetical protein [Myxococcales bacterium]